MRNFYSKAGAGFGRISRNSGNRRLIFLSVLLVIPIWAGPIFLDTITSDSERIPLVVMTGKKAELVVTLTAATELLPQLSADLLAQAGPLAAPVRTGAMLELHRVGVAQAGIQRFAFDLDVPVVERKQVFILKLRVRPSAIEAWLPLPPVMLESIPSTWKENLRHFAHALPSGRLEGSERINKIFQQAEVDVPETPNDSPVTSPEVRVWFAEVIADELHLPETPPRTVWVVFKNNVRDGFEIQRPIRTGPVMVFVDQKALDVITGDPVAQKIFEQALTTAITLTAAETNLP